MSNFDQFWRRKQFLLIHSSISVIEDEQNNKEMNRLLFCISELIEWNLKIDDKDVLIKGCKPFRISTKISSDPVVAASPYTLQNFLRTAKETEWSLIVSFVRYDEILFGDTILPGWFPLLLICNHKSRRAHHYGLFATGDENQNFGETIREYYNKNSKYLGSFFHFFSC
jgi:hypothetical protein